MTRVTFETATIADAVKKAARVAPAKSGHAFDKAAGLVIDIFPNEDAKCVVRATNLDIFSTEVVSVVDATGPEVRWRLSSTVLEGVVGTLPIQNGKQVTFEQKTPTSVLITSGRMRATLILMDSSYYPGWDSFDPDGMAQVNAIGSKIEMVEWAAAVGGQPPLCGVYLDGESAIASDRYRLARVPLRLDLPRPITIPAGILGSVIKPMGDVGIAVRGSTLEIAVDQYHQVQTIIYDVSFPNLDRVMTRDYEQVVEVSKAPLLDILNRANQFAGSDRAPLLKIYVGREEIAAMMENNEVGLLGDVIECPGQIAHPRATVCFTPKNLIQAIQRAPSSRVKLHYDDSAPHRPFFIEDGTGYEVWVIPRKEQRPEI